MQKKIEKKTRVDVYAALKILKKKKKHKKKKAVVRKKAENNFEKAY